MADLSSNQISVRNWSGDSVLSFTNKDIAVNIIKKALNIQDSDIWRAGVFGVLHAFKRKIKRFIETPWFNNIVLISVFLNTIILATVGLVDDESSLGTLLSNFNFVFTIIFTIEMVCKLIALGITGYTRDKMNIFDCGIVVISLVEQIFLDGGGSQAASAFRTVRLFRTFRVLRVTKILRSLAYMKIIMGVIMRSLNKFFLIFILLFLFIFIYSLLGMQIFGGNLNIADNIGQGRIRQNFDSFINAFIAVFQLMTQENWQELLFIMMRSDVIKPFSLAYLVSWIFIGNYIFLNLFLAIILDEFTGQEVEEELEEIEDEEKLYGATSIGGTTLDGKSTHLKTTSRNSSKTSLIKTWSSRMEGTDDESNVKGARQSHKEYQVIACKRTFYLISKENPIRVFCLRIIQHVWFERTILFMIVVSSIKLAIDTYISEDDKEIVQISDYFDLFLNIFFTLEALTKIISLGFLFDKGSYLRDTWNILDFVIVITSLLDTLLQGVDLGFLKVFIINHANY